MAVAPPTRWPRRVGDKVGDGVALQWRPGGGVDVWRCAETTVKVVVLPVTNSTSFSGAELHGGPGGPRTTGAYQAHRYRKIQSDRIRTSERPWPPQIRPAAVLRSFVFLRAAAMRPFVSP